MTTRRSAVILSDQRMPGMSGVEVLHQAQAIRPETTRLLFTAYADIRAVIDAINQGHVFRYITKPWEPDELEAVIRQAVERRDLIVERNRLVAELQAANAKLVEANRLKGSFLEVASHELNTPVTVVLGLTDLWKMSLGCDARARSGSGSSGSDGRAAPGQDGPADVQTGSEQGVQPGARTRDGPSRAIARTGGRSTSALPASTRPEHRAARSIRHSGPSRPTRRSSSTS